MGTEHSTDPEELACDRRVDIGLEQTRQYASDAALQGGRCTYIYIRIPDLKILKNEYSMFPTKKLHVQMFNMLCYVLPSATYTCLFVHISSYYKDYAHSIRSASFQDGKFDVFT